LLDQGDGKQFTSWCQRYQLLSLPAPAPVIALDLPSLARRGLAVSTIRRRAAAIARTHCQHEPARSGATPGVAQLIENFRLQIPAHWLS
jgi:hypothetical protein